MKLSSLRIRLHRGKMIDDQENNDRPLWPDDAPQREAPFVEVPFTPVTADETVRQSGLAWSAGIVFFGSVAFTLFLGWIADLLLGTSPWGLVGGIVLGSVIGFIQFFRISSQIYPSKTGRKDIQALLSPDDDDVDRGPGRF
ncbi:MAG: AtpZ/AtpI family protein [Pyrinomonadaceae bacterium]